MYRACIPVCLSDGDGFPSIRCVLYITFCVVPFLIVVQVFVPFFLKKFNSFFFCILIEKRIIPIAARYVFYSFEYSECCDDEFVSVCLCVSVSVAQQNGRTTSSDWFQCVMHLFFARTFCVSIFLFPWK